jgi:hypothetical protein
MNKPREVSWFKASLSKQIASGRPTALMVAEFGAHFLFVNQTVGV